MIPRVPLVLCVPGLSGNIKTFDFIGERVGGDSRQLVALDPRGRGGSETTPPGTYGWENHARDVVAVADALGFETFAVIGKSMGASVAMKIAELHDARLEAVVLVDVAGRVDPGIGPVIELSVDHLDTVYESAERYVDAVSIAGPGRAMERVLATVLALRAARGTRRGPVADQPGSSARGPARYAATQHPYDRWKYLTMPTLLLRRTRELRPGAGYTVPGADRDKFLREVRKASVVEVDANHLTITTHAGTATAIRDFLSDSNAG